MDNISYRGYFLMKECYKGTGNKFPDFFNPIIQSFIGRKYSKEYFIDVIEFYTERTKRGISLESVHRMVLDADHEDILSRIVSIPSLSSELRDVTLNKLLSLTWFTEESFEKICYFIARRESLFPKLSEKEKWLLAPMK